jgi:hypothetical protein
MTLGQQSAMTEPSHKQEVEMKAHLKAVGVIDLLTGAVFTVTGVLVSLGVLVFGPRSKSSCCPCTSNTRKRLCPWELMPLSPRALHQMRYWASWQRSWRRFQMLEVGWDLMVWEQYRARSREAENNRLVWQSRVGQRRRFRLLAQCRGTVGSSPTSRRRSP